MAGELAAPSRSKPLYRHDAARRNVELHGLSSDALKFPKSLCAPCNNSRTQPHDRAWEKMSTFIRDPTHSKALDTHIDARWIFGSDYVSGMLDVHLFFVKHLGCVVGHLAIAIDTTPLSDAIVNQTACPLVHLRFGLSPEFAHKAALSDVQLWTNRIDGTCVRAAYIYSIGAIFVKILYALDEGDIGDADDWWHPTLGNEDWIPLTSHI